MKKICKFWSVFIVATALLTLSDQTLAWKPRGQAPYPFPCGLNEENCHLKNLWVTVGSFNGDIVLSNGKEIDGKKLQEVVRGIFDKYPKKYRILFDDDLDAIGGHPMSRDYAGYLNEANTLRISIGINVTRSISPMYGALNITFRDGGLDYRWVYDFRPYVIRLDNNFVSDVSHALECNIVNRLYEEVSIERVKTMTNMGYVKYCD